MHVLGTLSILLVTAYSVLSGSQNIDDYGEISSLLKFSPEERESHISGATYQPYNEWKKRLAEDHGFNYLIEYGVITQWGSRGDDKFHADHELNLIGMWDLLDSPELGNGKFIGWFQNSQTLSGVTTTEMMQSLGVLSPINGGDTFPGNSANRVQHFAWEQRFSNDRFRVMIGKMTTRVLMNLNRYAVSDREDFFTPMIVNNPVVPFTARIGIGAFAEYSTDDWYVSGLMRDATATNDFLDFDSLSDGIWEYATEFGLTPDFDGLGEGQYRLTVHYTDEVDRGSTVLPSGWSISASFDQDLGESIGAYFRFAHAPDTFRAFDQRIAAGFQLMGPFSHPDDRIGVGFWRGRPTSRTLNSESGLEFFWRLQITPSLQISPDVQIIFDPAMAPSKSTVYTGGLRARLEF